MNQLTKLWLSLSLGQRISLVLVPLAIAASIFGFVRWKHDNGFRVLYGSLAPEDAAAVTQKMRESGIEYRLDETGATVLVPVEHLAEARLALAGAGLPKTGRIGFELFDRNNLGASDFAEQVNYRRALEGELERTVATLSEIDQARVHITFAKESVFLDNKEPSKATVVLRLKGRTQISQSSVNAIANLIASAVEGLSPGAVAIIDSAGRLLNRPRAEGAGDTQLAEANLEYRQQVESMLLAKINSALTPLLGADRFRSSVTADCDFSSTEQSDEVYDSAKSAVLSSQSTEESSGGQLAGGTPGTAASLPRPPNTPVPGSGAATGTAGLSRRTESVAYQPSRSVKRTVVPKGEIRRISVAVLLDQTVRWDGTGPKAKKTLIPPSPEVIKGVHDLVAGVTAFDAQRGDQITVETLPFESTNEAEPPAPPVAAGPVPPRSVFDLKQPAVLGAAGAIVLLLALVIFFALRRGSRRTSAPEMNAALATSEPGKASLASISTEQKIKQQIADNEAEQAQLEAEALQGIKLPPNSRKSEALVKHVRDSVHKDSVNATNVLRTWITDTESRKSS
jgi:flagellar M-ring protein FliF